MHIVIDEYGVQVAVENNMFSLTTDATKKLVSYNKVNSINLLKPCNISTPALVLAAQQQIPVLIYNAIGRVEVFTWSSYYGNIATLRRKQLLFTSTAPALVWIQEIIQRKTTAQVNNIAYFKNKVPKLYQTCATTITQIHSIITDNTSLEQIRVYEAAIAKLYWGCILQIVQPYITTPGIRVKQGAQDVFNIGINYCYGILYGIVESSLLMHGLDPYTAILHTDRYARPTLAYDQIEPFRPLVDNIIVQLVLNAQLTNASIVTNSDGQVVLTKTAKQIMIEHFFAVMHEKKLLHHKRIKTIDHIHHCNAMLVKAINQTTL
jgi:CRISP-associated protein Cas1